MKNDLGKQILRGILFSLFPIFAIIDWELWKVMQDYDPCAGLPKDAVVACIRGGVPISMQVYFFGVVLLFIANIFLVRKIKPK